MAAKYWVHRIQHDQRRVMDLSHKMLPGLLNVDAYPPRSLRDYVSGIGSCRQ